MKIRVSHKTFAIISVLVCFLVAAAGSVLAQEQIRTQSMIQSQEQVDEAVRLRLRLKSQLRKETGLTSEEVDDLDPLLDEGLRLNGGDTEAIRKMVRKAVQIDCVGECLMERLRQNNRKMLQLKETVEDGHVASRERVRTRTRTRDGEQTGDTTRTETQTQNQNQDGSGSGGSGNGSKNK